MSNPFKPAGKIKGIPTQVQRLTTQVPFEVLEETKKEVLKGKDFKPSDLGPGSTGVGLSPEEIAARKKEEEKRYRELKRLLDEEIEKARRVREEREKRYLEEVEEKLQPSEKPPEAPPVISSVPSRGKPGAKVIPQYVLQKQGTKEMGKAPTG